ncbi:MAG TPA: NUDIX domain-containing protein [Chitinophagaceae bacterium]|nr:NUDIX domain-containing protein [Chitinophagaceae bacterium]
MKQGRFTIRVYGILFSENGHVLLSDERIGNFCFTKFPGGGLEFGEGLHEGLIREWKEELDMDIRVGEHIYTTDFFQASAFDSHKQVIAVYYRVFPEAPLPAIPLRMNVTPYHYKGEEEIHFRFFPLTHLEGPMLSFPIDQYVTRLLKEKFTAKT